MVPRDTSRDSHARQQAALRAMTGEQRLRMAMAMSDEIRLVLLAGIQARRSAGSDDNVMEAFEAAVLGTELARARRNGLPRT